MLLSEEEYLEHYGTPRRSGRYPWGSGGPDDIANKRNKEFLDYVKELKTKGIPESQIAQGLGMTTLQLRAAQSSSTNNVRQANITMAERLKEKGTSTTEIGRRMGVPEPTVRSWLAPGAREKASILQNTTNMLRANVDEKGFIDVGKGTEHFVGVSRTRLDTAVAQLVDEGYTVHQVKVPQVTNTNKTTMRVLAPPGTKQKDVFLNQDKITQITNFSDDGGRSFGHLHEPIALDPKRVSVKFKEDGGDESDGMIYVRPGKDDISLGGKNYAQVRVAVGKDHYLKGMAIYKDDLPAGTDVEFHTSKSKTANKLDVMKKNSDEKGFVEGGPHVLLKSVTRQIVDHPDTPDERVKSAMNIVNEEGNWDKWSRSLSSQMLSKQRPVLARSQLEMTYERRRNQLDAINSMTNPVVRKKLLMDFADDVDSSAVQLNAAILPRSAVHVIMPLSKIKPTEIYAPDKYKDGDVVVLIRHPHGGTFEIPRLTVNNKNPEGKRILKNAKDAVGIHHTVAKQLSGADFDGDTVLVIPDRQSKIKSSHPLDGLKDFDPRSSYPGYPGMKRMANTQTQIGEVSNLITDMSLREAPHSEIARAVRHSMVVIDAEKHFLNYKQSYQDNGIRELKKKYQTGGASTLISRATAEQRVPERKPRTRPRGGPIDLETGARAFEPTNRRKSDGSLKLEPVPRLALTRDARTLMSTPTGTPMERLYADHSNKLKSLAGTARLTAVKTPTPKTSASSKKAYESEVKSLNNKLAIAERNAPLERQAQLIANANIKARTAASPNMDQSSRKKIANQALVQARTRTGASKSDIIITDREWDAIQANAISPSKLNSILNNADMTVVREHAAPKNVKLMTSAKTNRAMAMLASGYSRAYVAEHLGVSLSTLDLATQGE